MLNDWLLNGIILQFQSITKPYIACCVWLIIIDQNTYTGWQETAEFMSCGFTQNNGRSPEVKMD